MVSVQGWVFNPATNQVKYPPAGGFHKLKKLLVNICFLFRKCQTLPFSIFLSTYSTLWNCCCSEFFGGMHDIHTKT